MKIRDCPLFTTIYSDSKLFVPINKSAYIFATSEEERSYQALQSQSVASGIEYIRIENQSANEFVANVAGLNHVVKLRSENQLRSFFDNLPVDRFYIDITGIGHNVWAPLIRAGIQTGKEILAVYVEPNDYNLITTADEGEVYDLSEKTEGIKSIAGFAPLRRPYSEAVYFVPLLGFEGPRFIRMLEEVDLPSEKIIPVIGVPGFRPEYPFRTYQANKFPLMKSESWQNARFAKANCASSLFYELESIRISYKCESMKIALIGTKPNALGAILFAIANPQGTEILYDHPIRKAKRTSGLAQLLVYHISSLMSLQRTI